MYVSKNKVSVDSCRFLICQNQEGNLRSFSDLVKNQKIRHIQLIRDFGSVSDFTKKFNRFRPDIIYLDYDHLPDGALEVVNTLRFGYMGNNPYVPIVFSSGQDSRMLKTALNCGVDMFLKSPFTFEDLTRQILALVDFRPPYIASHDYIGPQRSAHILSSHTKVFHEEPDFSEKLFEVPNLFAMKAKGNKITQQEEQSLIKNAIAMTSKEILRKRAFIIRSIIKNLSYLNQYRLYPKFAKMKDFQLQQLFNNALVSKKRLEKTELVHIAEMYDSLLDVIRSLQNGKISFGMRQVELMEHTASGIIHSFAGDQKTISQASDITKTVKSYANPDLKPKNQEQSSAEDELATLAIAS